ncbi:MAG: ABC transporter permease [Candidatus Acidiferrales bacterium]
MNATPATRSQRIFRALLSVLPFDFRVNYGHEMEGVFDEQQHEIKEQGGLMGFLRLWGETIAGIFRTAPSEHWEILKQDMIYGLRMMRRNVGFTIVAVLTLGLGIGANTAIFSVVHAVLLRPLPYPEGNQLVLVRQQAQKEGIQDMTFSAHEIEDYRGQNRTLSGLVEYHNMSFILYGHGDPDRILAAVVSANYFDLFKVQPLLGRTFLPEDDKLGAPAVLIFSYEYWKNKFGADPAIVGKTFELNDRVHTVVGVLPPVPQYPVESDVYMPTSACPFRSGEAFIQNRDSRMLQAFGRLKPGVTITQARADLATIAGRLKSEYPKSYPEGMGYAAVSSPLQDELTRSARPTLIVLLAAAAFVLLIACANVANLTLARMSRRERELAVRTALGAGRSRLLRQLLTESFMMAVVGGALGLILAYSSLQLLTEFAARLTPRAREINIDGGVLVFTLLAALGTSLVFGTISAIFSRANLASNLKEGSTGSGAGRMKNRVRSALIISQVAFSFMLLIGAGLMLRSLVKILRVNPGFVPQRVLAMRATLSFNKYATPEKLLEVLKKMIDRVQAEPGVVSAAISSSYPLEPEAIAAGPDASASSFKIEGRDLAPGEALPVGSFVAVSPGYFRTLGIPLIAGREITDADGGKGEQVAIINEAMRRRSWAKDDPIGKRLSFDDGKTWQTIIGVIGDVREFGLDRPIPPEIYLPHSEYTAPATLAVRTIADPRAMSTAITRALHEVDPQLAVTHIVTLEQARAESTASPRVTASLLGIFAGLALLIAAAGIGGIMALAVSQRVREIGIRIALGAQPAKILRMILGQGLLLAALGVAIGLAGALAVTHLVKSLLFEVAPTDPVTFAGVATVLISAAIIASYLPARRAAAIDPIEALRME